VNVFTSISFFAHKKTPIRGAQRLNRKEKTLAQQGFQVVVSLERVMGIEPTLSAWKAEVLPLNYTRINT